MRFCWVSIQTLKANIQDIASIYQSTCVINSDVSFHVLAVSLWQRQMEAGPQSFGLKQLLFVTGDRSTHSRACSQNIFMGARQIFNILVCYKKSIWKTETCSCSPKCWDQKCPSIQSFITMTVLWLSCVDVQIQTHSCGCSPNTDVNKRICFLLLGLLRSLDCLMEMLKRSSMISLLFLEM